MSIPSSIHEIAVTTAKAVLPEVVPAGTGSHSPSILSLRLTSDYLDAVTGAPILTTVSVAKPPKAHFFRVSADPAHQAVYALLDGNKLGVEGMYAISPEVAAEFPDHVRVYHLRLAVTTFNAPYLIPVPLPGADGRRNVWHTSLAHAMELAEKEWIRISANTMRGSYDVFRALNQQQKPEWPESSFDAILEIAFRDRLILNREHPLLAQLRGE